MATTKILTLGISIIFIQKQLNFNGTISWTKVTCSITLFFQESEKRGRNLGCQLATAQATAVPSQRLLYRLGYTSLYTMDYTTFEIAGDRVFDVDKMLGTPSAKVMARLLKAEDEQPSPQEWSWEGKAYN